MRSGPVSLDFPMEFLYVMCHGQKRNRCSDTDHPETQEPPEGRVCLQLPETFFWLDAPVHPQQASFLTRDAFGRPAVTAGTGAVSATFLIRWSPDTVTVTLETYSSLPLDALVAAGA